MDLTTIEEALNTFNNIYEERIAQIDSDPSLDESGRCRAKIEFFQSWKDSLIKHVKELIGTVCNATNFLNQSYSDSGDEISRASELKSAEDHKKFSTRLASLKELIKELGARSQQALDELSDLAKLFERQMHSNRSLSEENVTLKSDLEKLRNQTTHYNQLAEKILTNMREESDELKRFFVEYEQRMHSIENDTTRHSSEMTRRLHEMQSELSLKDKRIHTLEITIQKSSDVRPTITIEPPSPPHSTPSVDRQSRGSSKESGNIFEMSYEINLTDVEATDDVKMRTLEEGATTMASLLKQKQRMLRDQKGTIEKLLHELKRSKKYREKFDKIRTELDELKEENIDLSAKNKELRSASGDSNKLKEQLDTIASEKKRIEETFTRQISTIEKQLQTLANEKQELISSNIDFYKCVTVAYQQLGECLQNVDVEK